VTPQESELVDELFNRLVQLEIAQRDPEAERLIAEGLRRAPHAVYALVQTVLLQDEGLKRFAPPNKIWPTKTPRKTASKT
jgi:hypothetical protein